jgi:hypothetical protein
MVHTRTGMGSPQLSSAMGSDSGSEQRGEVRQRAAAQRGVASGGGAAAGSPAHTHLQRAGFLALLCYLAWFGLILGGILAYEGGCRGIAAAGQSKALQPRTALLPTASQPKLHIPCLTACRGADIGQVKGPATAPL